VMCFGWVRQAYIKPGSPYTVELRSGWQAEHIMHEMRLFAKRNVIFLDECQVPDT
jgi:hypothetical protein